ncbi:DUF2750 domain-containing protein [Thalassotalea litorea]|uniref:DUF2750 domain-containing protein n=1 Tax=Thalassotalea litorea TaxID=2020715 RepID=UPI00373543E0
MSVGAQIEKFYQEATENDLLWFGEYSDGRALEFDVKGGKVSFPLWSSKSRILRLKKLNPDLLKDIEPKGMSWSDFKKNLLPILQEKDRFVNLNLAGKNLSGFDLPLEQLINNFEKIISAS